MARRVSSGALLRAVAALALVVVALGMLFADCTRERLSAAVEALEARTVRRYAEVLAGSGGARVAVERCVMFTGSRSAHCLFHGSEHELVKVVAALGWKGAATSHVVKRSCLELQGFGRKLGSPPIEYRDVEPGVKLFLPGSRALPPNQDNVKFLRLYVAPDGRACAELTFPYG
jgi:hypothetical protein